MIFARHPSYVPLCRVPSSTGGAAPAPPDASATRPHATRASEPRSVPGAATQRPAPVGGLPYDPRHLQRVGPAVQYRAQQEGPSVRDSPRRSEGRAPGLHTPADAIPFRFQCPPLPHRHVSGERRHTFTVGVSMTGGAPDFQRRPGAPARGPVRARARMRVTGRLSAGAKGATQRARPAPSRRGSCG
jgi:hypothetical protein